MDRHRAGVGAGQAVVRAREPEVAFAAPDQANDLDRLLERDERVAGLAARPAIRLDGIPEAASTQCQFEASAAQHVETGGRLGHHCRRAQREVGDIGEETHASGDGRDCAEQGPGVDEAPLVRMILNADPVETAGLDLPGGVEQRVGGVGDQEISERQVAAVVGHRHTLSRKDRAMDLQRQSERLLTR